MKKKIIGVLVFLITMVGVMFLMGVFDKAGGTEEDHKAGEEIVKDLEDAYDNIETPDFEEDTTEIEDEEEFDPEAML